MAVHRGSGRVPLPPELIRTKGTRVYLTVGEHTDLLTIAEGWGVPPATAAYAMVAVYLAECRQRSVNLGHAGLKIAASSRMLAAHGERRNRK